MPRNHLGGYGAQCRAVVPGTQQLQDGAALITDLGVYGPGGPMACPLSWARSSAQRRRRRRGMRDPELVVGDGAMGLWKALTEAFPAARHQKVLGSTRPVMLRTPCRGPRSRVRRR